MRVEQLVETIGSDFFVGVPDSQLRPLCDYLMKIYGISNHHIIAANEGNATAIGAGYHLATGKVPVIYMQNSGIGNVLNPVVSLMNEKVYGIPCVFIIGWRGEPGVDDEPQHVYQGDVTLKLLQDMDIHTYVIDRDTTYDDLEVEMRLFRELLACGKQVGFVVRKDALQFDCKVKYTNDNFLTREEVIRHIVSVTDNDLVVATTGKASRELFEIREQNSDGHGRDFLTVGSMGHSSSIALGIALQNPNRMVWVIDGDGAALMHMGAMALIGSNKPKNLVHIIINNGAHESVGGMPTVAESIDLVGIAKACGYLNVMKVKDVQSLDEALQGVRTQRGLSFLEVEAAIGARVDLGRPTISAKENKEDFMMNSMIH